MKLNETLFKPLFLKIVEWAQVSGGTQSTTTTTTTTTQQQQVPARISFFYRLVDAVADKLKVSITHTRVLILIHVPQ